MEPVDFRAPQTASWEGEIEIQAVLCRQGNIRFQLRHRLAAVFSRKELLPAFDQGTIGIDLAGVDFSGHLVSRDHDLLQPG